VDLKNIHSLCGSIHAFTLEGHLGNATALLPSANSLPLR
jgi:hypothetical protein